MEYTARAKALAAALALLPACSQPSGQEPVRPGGEPRITLAAAESGRLAIDVEGMAPGDLERLQQDPPSQDAWEALLRVQVARGDAASSTLPPVLGDYAVHGGALRFTPSD